MTSSFLIYLLFLNEQESTKNFISHFYHAVPKISSLLFVAAPYLSNETILRTGWRIFGILFANTVQLVPGSILGTQPVFGSPKGEVGLVPVSLEGDARVRNRQDCHSKDDHGAFEDHEGNLIICELAAKALF